jgi:hypothetical protein
VVIRARRTSPWHAALGVGRDLEGASIPGQAALSVPLRQDRWRQTVPDATTAVAAFPPALLGVAYEFWKKRQVDSDLWRLIGQRTTRRTMPRMDSAPRRARMRLADPGWRGWRDGRVQVAVRTVAAVRAAE